MAVNDDSHEYMRSRRSSSGWITLGLHMHRDELYRVQILADEIIEIVTSSVNWKIILHACVGSILMRFLWLDIPWSSESLDVYVCARACHGQTRRRKTWNTKVNPRWVAATWLGTSYKCVTVTIIDFIMKCFTRCRLRVATLGIGVGVNLNLKFIFRVGNGPRRTKVELFDEIKNVIWLGLIATRSGSSKSF